MNEHFLLPLCSLDGPLTSLAEGIKLALLPSLDGNGESLIPTSGIINKRSRRLDSRTLRNFSTCQLLPLSSPARTPWSLSLLLVSFCSLSACSPLLLTSLLFTQPLSHH